MTGAAHESYFAQLDVGPAALVRLERILAADERTRADRFRFERDRRRFVVRRGLLRRWLARQVGAPPEQLEFETGAWGKPRLVGHTLEFSASHRGEWMMAVSSRVEIGCDIEQIDETLDWRPLAALLSDGEHTGKLGAIGTCQGRQEFFRGWVRLEAAAKATGRGLADLPCTDGTHRSPLDEPGLRVIETPCPPGHLAAIAVRDRPMAYSS